jgi:hypothetical protein
MNRSKPTEHNVLVKDAFVDLWRNAKRAGRTYIGSLIVRLLRQPTAKIPFLVRAQRLTTPPRCRGAT